MPGGVSRIRSRMRVRPSTAASAMLLVALIGQAAPVGGAEAQWIWSPAFEKEQAPVGACYFRKSFTLGAPDHGEVEIAADDSYTLYVNGREVGQGDQFKTLDKYDVTRYLVQGINTVAVKAENKSRGAAGLVARVWVKQQGSKRVYYSTDASWKTSLRDAQDWQKIRFADAHWLAARKFGLLGNTLPWGKDTVSGDVGRFKTPSEFQVEWVIEGDKTGSLIAMTFDEFGNILASRENGPLLAIRDENKDGLVETVSTYCHELKNCQGILCVSGRVFAVGQGPAGPGLYRLTDEDQNGTADRVETLLKFSGEMGEHGPHGLVFGPDGLIYMIAGNFSHPEKAYEPTSPLPRYYEGDLIAPRYEDASGHAVGIKAPGGTVLRTDTNGSAVELVAGGLQNPYDLVFNQEGELFTADSDLEWDLGMAWYRPTRLNHVVAGGEYGWRSGWAKWPEYYLDSLPATLELGRGSPTGIEVYNHHMYPVRFHNALIVCDWSRGRILAVKTKPKGASYEATSEVFVEGQPLNVTDAAVGPDGWLYFTTGGRGTDGGLYRVVWEGKIPPEVTDPGKGIAQALKQPQLNSAWARQRIALLKQQLGASWTKEIPAIAADTLRPVAERAKALDLLQLFGPLPTTELLVKLSSDRQPMLRAKAATLLGVGAHQNSAVSLTKLLEDKDPAVQQAACEALLRTRQHVKADKLIKLLSSPDRHLVWTARRALGQMPLDEWQGKVLDSTQPRVFIEGSVALLQVETDVATASAILDRSSLLMEGYLPDTEFLDLLRVMQLALQRGNLTTEGAAELGGQLAQEYPSRDQRMNRELVRLLAYLQQPNAVGSFMQQLRLAELPPVEKMHIAMHARFLQVGWTMMLKLELLKFYEEARAMQGGHSFAGYVDNASRDFAAGFTNQERFAVLAGGTKWPSAAFSVLATLPDDPGVELLAEIRKLDQQIKTVDSDAARRLRIGVAAVLGKTADPDAQAYLRELFEHEPDRRVALAMALSQRPSGENWSLLVGSLSFVEGAAAQEVMTKLAEVDRKPEEPEALRQLILRGLLLGDTGGQQAVALLEKWTGHRVGDPQQPPVQAIAAWQTWFAEKYPEQPEPKLPVDSQTNKWTYQELLSHLTGTEAAQANPARGAAVYQKAQCAKCHRSGSGGDGMGPDLTTLSMRFTRKEILESILFPSQVIGDQYAGQTVLTTDGRMLSGLMVPAGEGTVTLLQSSGDKVTLAEDEIEERTRSKKSVMPEGLLNSLSLTEIADLFAFLTQRAETNLASRPKSNAR